MCPSTYLYRLMLHLQLYNYTTPICTDTLIFFCRCLRSFLLRPHFSLEPKKANVQPGHDVTDLLGGWMNWWPCEFHIVMTWHPQPMICTTKTSTYRSLWKNYTQHSSTSWGLEDGWTPMFVHQEGNKKKTVIFQCSKQFLSPPHGILEDGTTLDFYMVNGT